MADDMLETSHTATSTIFSPNTSRPTAAIQVLNIYELVENILLRLSLEDIILAANTSDFIRQVVESPKSIATRFYHHTSTYGHNTHFESTGQKWPADASFAFSERPYFPGRSAFQEYEIFVHRKGEYEAIGIFKGHRSLQPSLKIIDGVNTQMTFKPPGAVIWEVKVCDQAWSASIELELDTRSSFPYRYDATRYMRKFHGQPEH